MEIISNKQRCSATAPRRVVGMGRALIAGLALLGVKHALGQSVASAPSGVNIAVTVSNFVSNGPGFASATAQPATVGSTNQVGYSAKAIARWNVVPFQTFSETFAIGVLAFHREGINRVEFSANGGVWVSVYATSTNPQTNTMEYVATLNAADFPDGPLEVRAIAYPNVGAPVVLAGPLDVASLTTGTHSLYLNANFSKKLTNIARYVSPTGSDTNTGLTASSPFATLYQAAYSIHQAQGNADGGHIYLLPGSYTILSAARESLTVNRWLTIKPAPGYSKSDVIIKGSTYSGIYNKLVKFEDVTITGGIDSGGPLVDYIWLDNVRVVGPGRTAGFVTQYSSSWTGRYITNSAIVDSSNGAIDFHLARAVHLERIGSDAFSNCGLVVNCTAKDVDPAEQVGNYHPDIYQSASKAENVVLYNLVAIEAIGRTQGFQFNVPPGGVAIVNCNIKATWNLGGEYANVIAQRSSIKSTFLPNFIAKDVVYDGISFYDMTPPPWPGVTLR